MRLPRLKLFVGGYAAFSVALVLGLLLNSIGTLRAVQERSQFERAVTDKLVENLAVARLEAVQVQQFITDAAATGNEEGLGWALRSVTRAQDALNQVARLDERLSAQVQQLRHDIEQLHVIGQVMVEAYRDSREEGNAFMRAPLGFDFQVRNTVNHLGKLTSEIENISRESLAQQDAALERSKTQIVVLGILLCALSVFAGLFVYRQVFSALSARERALESLRQVLDELLPSRESQGVLQNSDIEQLATAIVVMVHEREENRASLQRAKEAAESSDRAKTEFLANLSHEVRTPLNGILGMAEVLEMGALDDQQTLALTHLRTSAGALLALLLRLLDYAHIEASEVIMELAPLSVTDLTQALLYKQMEKAQAKGLSLTCTIAPNVPPIVRGDEVHIAQVLNELVDNAIKFSSAGEVRLEVAVHGEAETGTARLHIAVADSGPGIDPEQFDHMFRAFTQIDGSMTRSHGGVGLGLALCRSLARAMGGDILVESAPGKGARFTLELPLKI